MGLTSRNIHTILGIDNAKINWFPQSTVEEILQNIAILLTTIRGSVVLDRNLGLDSAFIDSPAPQAMMKLRIFAIETIQEYEPRVQVQEVDFVPNPDAALEGRLYPRVVVRILDEYLS